VWKYLLIFVCIASSVWADVTVENFTVDSSLNNISWIGIPRHRLGILPEDGHLAIIKPYWSGSASGARQSLMFTTDVTNTDWATRWQYRTDKISLNMSDHAHMSTLDSTLWVMNANVSWKAYENGDTMVVPSSLHTFSTVYTEIMSLCRVPGTDTLIAISRYHGSGVDVGNILYFISPDLGVNWSDSQYVCNWSAAATDTRRMGLFNFNNTVWAVLDSNNYKYPAYEWNRTTQTWDYKSNAIDKPNSSMRTYSFGNMDDSVAFVATGNPLTWYDSIYVSYRTNSEGVWHQYVIDANGYDDATSWSPQTAMTFVKSSSRLVLFFTRRDGGGTADSTRVYMTWCQAPNYEVWSTPVKVSIGKGALYNNGSMCVSTAPFTPVTHGDMAYLGYSMDSTYIVEGSNVLFHFLNIAKITFSATSNVTHTLTEISHTSNSITVSDTYEGAVGVIDTVWALYGTNATYPGVDSLRDITSLGSPDTITVNLLNDETDYYIWMGVSDDNGIHISEIPIMITTTTIANNLTFTDSTINSVEVTNTYAGTIDSAVYWYGITSDFASSTRSQVSTSASPDVVSITGLNSSTQYYIFALIYYNDVLEDQDNILTKTFTVVANVMSWTDSTGSTATITNNHVGIIDSAIYYYSLTNIFTGSIRSQSSVNTSISIFNLGVSTYYWVWGRLYLDDLVKDSDSLQVKTKASGVVSKTNPMIDYMREVVKKWEE
jgi:hypothetical protein